MKPTIAFHVRCGHEASTIAFATSNVAARRLGANELGLEFEEITNCTRCADLDKYAAQGYVDTEVLIEEHSWVFECPGCFSLVSNLTEGRSYDKFGEVHCPGCANA